jgi:malonyl-CoA decarboxylase
LQNEPTFKTNLPKIVEVVQVDSVYDTIKQVIELRDRSISSLTLERLVKKFCQAYENLDPQQKQDVLLHLASKYYIKEEDLKGKAAEIVHTKEYEILMKKEQELRTILDPPYNWLFSKLAQIQQNGVKFLGDIRADVLTILLESKSLPNDQRLALKTMSGHLRELLTHWFSAGLLELEQVTWQSSCSMLQKISEYEAVHPVKSWADIKSRVGPYRRCFVFTHRQIMQFQFLIRT